MNRISRRALLVLETSNTASQIHIVKQTSICILLKAGLTSKSNVETIINLTDSQKRYMHEKLCEYI